MEYGDKKPVIYAILIAMLFGGTAPVAKLLLEETAPLTLAALLYIGSGAGLLLYYGTGWLRGRDRNHAEASLKKSDLPWIAGVILFGGILAPVVLMYSMQATPAMTAAMLLNFEPVATTIFAAVIFREHVGGKVWVALSLITGACLLLAWEPGAAFGVSLAAVGILLTCTFWALDNNISQKLAGKDPLATVILKGIGAGAIVLGVALLLGQPLPPVDVAFAAMTLGFVSYGGLTSVLFLFALRGIGTARTGAYLAMAPLFGVAFSVLLLAEQPDLMFGLAVPLMALGALLLISEEHSHHHHHPAGVHEHRHRHDDGHHDHDHSPGDPAPDARGYHSHTHRHEEVVHEHPHKPDIHHRHGHGR
ncbi:MAG: DMT family transporter [Methanomicrobiaceae archaeon]|nr:DMT family transporter [Methanomicrobiaceae archaeon]